MLCQLVLSDRPCVPQQGRLVPSLASFPEGDVQLFDKDVTVPIISNPNDGVAVLNLEKARRMGLERMVAERRDGR